METTPAQVIIYSKPSGCFGCTKTKALFEKAGVPFIEVDITVNAAALEYISEELGYVQAPVVTYEQDGSINHWSGLDPVRIAQTVALYREQNNLDP